MSTVDARWSDVAAPRWSTDKFSRAEWAAGVTSAALLLILTPLLLIEWHGTQATDVNIALGIAIVLFSGWRLVVALRSGEPTLLRHFFFVFVYVFLGVAALAQVVAQTYPLHESAYGADAITRALIVVGVGTLAYDLGWRASVRTARKVTIGSDPAKKAGFSQTRVVLLGLFGVLYAAHLIGQFGLHTFFSSRNELTATLVSGNAANAQFYDSTSKTGGLLRMWLAQMPVFVALFCILYARRHRLWQRPQSMLAKLSWGGFVAALIACNVIVNNFKSNGRWWFLLVAVGFASIYLPYTKRRSVRLLVAVSLFMLLFAFSALDVFRTSAGQVNFAGPRQDLVTNDSYTAFQAELNGVTYLSDHPHTAGRQLAVDVLAFVPHKIWPSKPPATGYLIDPHYVRASSMWTEFQVDFGVVGVIVLMGLYGFASGALEWRARQAGPGLLHAVLPVAATFQIFLLRGSLLPAMGALYQLAAMFLIVAAWQPQRLRRFIELPGLRRYATSAYSRGRTGPKPTALERLATGGQRRQVRTRRPQ